MINRLFRGVFAVGLSATMAISAQSVPCADVHPVVSSSACTAVCAGSSVVLDAGAGYAAYRWSNGATTQRIVLSTPEASAEYWCEVRTEAGCSARSEGTKVVIRSAPAKPYIVQKDTLLLATEAEHVVWLRNGQVLGNSDQAQIVIHDSADYQIIVTDANGCSATSEVLHSQALAAGQSTRGRDARLKVYPNPSNGNVAVQLISDYEGDIAFELFDVQGKQLYSTTWRQPAALDVIHLDLQSLPDGSYILQARDGVDVVTTNIVIQH